MYSIVYTCTRIKKHLVFDLSRSGFNRDGDAAASPLRGCAVLRCWRAWPAQQLPRYVCLRRRFIRIVVTVELWSSVPRTESGWNAFYYDIQGVPLTLDNFSPNFDGFTLLATDTVSEIFQAPTCTCERASGGNRR